jgi:nucleotide-binding universal stress UspA family protein
MSDTALRRVLVATDFSVVADTAVERAAELAGAHHAELRLVHAVVYIEAAEVASALTAATYEQLLRTAGARLEELAVRLRGRGLRVSTAFDFGQPAQLILREAGQWRPDLLVVGTRGLGGWRHLLLGSTAERVIEQATCPVLAVHEGDPQRPLSGRRVLAATDFSAGARAALGRAVSLLDLGAGDSLVLAHVFHVPAMVTSPVVGPHVAAVAADGTLRQDALAALDREAAPLRAQGLPARWELLEGYPPEALVAAARRLGVDLVVMGTRGRTGLAHLLLGSTAERVLQRAPCPVLVVPAAAERMADAAPSAAEEPVATAVAAVDPEC